MVFGLDVLVFPFFCNICISHSSSDFDKVSSNTGYKLVSFGQMELVSMRITFNSRFRAILTEIGGEGVSYFG